MKTCHYSYLCYTSRLLLPNSKLFLKVAAGSWRCRFLFHWVRDDNKVLIIYANPTSYSSHCQEPEESSSSTAAFPWIWLPFPSFLKYYSLGMLLVSICSLFVLPSELAPLRHKARCVYSVKAEALTLRGASFVTGKAQYTMYCHLCVWTHTCHRGFCEQEHHGSLV